MKIYTKTGDDGHTICLDGEEILKSDPRIHAVGAIDELAAAIGLVRVACGDSQPELREQLKQYQELLVEIMAVVSAGGNYISHKISDDDAVAIEQTINGLMEKAGPLNKFVYPGDGSEISARLHVARATCRRAERMVVAFSQQSAQAQKATAVVLKYLNRLGDLLFAMAVNY